MKQEYIDRIVAILQDCDEELLDLMLRILIKAAE